MRLRPRDLPRLRADIVRFGHASIFENLVYYPGQLSQEDETRRSLAVSMQEACTLQEAELFYVDERMCDLAFAAAGSLPEFRLELHDAPSRDGFIWLDKEIADTDPTLDPIYVAAISWRTQANTFLVSIHVLRDRGTPKNTSENLRQMGFPLAYPLGAWRLPLDADGRPIPIYGGMDWVEDEKSGVAGLASLAVLKSLWLLMRQPLTQETVAQPDRAERRRAARDGQAEPPPVRIIQLRRPAGSRGDGSGSVEWHHQWIVRGHWRNQSYGPGRQQRRPTWISPFVKGPEGAPMLGGEKVYTVRGDQRDQTDQQG